MELDKNLVNLQGALYSFSMQGLLNKRDTLHQVIKELKDITEDTPDDTKLKLSFLMVLYTKLLVSEKLQYDNFVGQYINVEPYLEKEYLVVYVYHLGLYKELFKVIENCPGPLGYEILEEIIKKLKEPEFQKLECGLEHLCQLWQSVFVKLHKLVTRVPTEKYAEKFANSFLDIYDLIEKALITQMSSKSEFDGLLLYYFFKVFLFCIMLQKTGEESDDPLYQLSIQFDLCNECDCPKAMINCIEKVFKKIPNILKCLTIDMWMFFSECYCNADSKNSVQLLIGDSVYCILKELNEGEKLYNVPSDVSGFLSSIAINKSDLIANAGIEEVISNVQNGEKEWFKALVKHSDFVTQEAIKCLTAHLELADSDDFSAILNTSYNYLLKTENSDDLDLMKKLFLTALKMTPDHEQWLIKIFENYQPNLLTTSETHEDLIETFNKISKGNTIPHSDFISLSVQSPLETIKKICHIAVYGSEQTEFVIEILKLLKHPCNLLHLDHFTLLDYLILKYLLKESTDKEKQSFIDLIIHLGKENLLGPSFHNNLLKCLKEYLENDALEKAVLCLEIVNAILSLKIFKYHTAAFLVFMCQVLGHFSWDLNTFSNIKADGQEQIDGILTFIITELKENENDSGFQWARLEILKSWEVNQAYFCDLWFKFNLTWSKSGSFHSLMLALAHSHHKSDELRNFLINFEKPFEVRASIILSLTMILPVLTFSKWNSIFNELIIIWEDISSGEQNPDVYNSVLDMFGSALQMLSMNLKQQEDTFSCYTYCLRNFAKLSKQSYPKMMEASLVKALEKIFLILGEIEDEEKRKYCWEIFSPLLMELIERLKKKNAVEIYRNEIEELLPFLDLKDVAESLLKKLH